jgi:hypothetical protein
LLIELAAETLVSVVARSRGETVTWPAVIPDLIGAYERGVGGVLV